MLSPLDSAEGILVTAAIRDISVRKAAESERRFRAVLEASANGVVAIDAQGLIVYVNPQVEVTFGYAPAEVLGQPVEMLLPERLARRHVRQRDGFIAHPVARPAGIGLDLAT